MQTFELIRKIEYKNEIFAIKISNKNLSSKTDIEFVREVCLDLKKSYDNYFTKI